MGIEWEDPDWTPDPSKLNSPDRTEALTELSVTLSRRMVHADARETVALSRELTRVHALLDALKQDDGDEVERARKNYQSKARGSGTSRSHLSAVPPEPGIGSN